MQTNIKNRGIGSMKTKKSVHKRTILFTAIFLLINILAVIFLGNRELAAMQRSLSEHAQNTQEQFEDVFANYKKSFRVFTQMMAREIENNPDPDAVWEYLKSIDGTLLDIEGETFDGLYMYYQGRYLYSWDTPYSEYADTGYVATERPWYQAAVEGNGEIVFTPPYMSYANHYILTTISQLQPDGETVFAYDIKMGDIQSLVAGANQFENEQVLIYDGNGTVIGSTKEDYLGGSLYASAEESALAVEEAREELAQSQQGSEEAAKAQEKLHSAEIFSDFRQKFDSSFEKLRGAEGKAVATTVDGKKHFSLLLSEGDFSFLVSVPVSTLLKSTTEIWLVPFLLIEMLLIYIFGRVKRERRNRELRAAYVQLGQVQKRLEIALSAAQKAAAVDDLTGMMNDKSFRKGMAEQLAAMEDDDHGILIMIDGDHFKQVNDTYGHTVGDEVIKLSAQMIIGRIRTVDLASRLHGDEFAIFIADTTDYSVAKRIMEDINRTIAQEAKKRNIPAITLSAGGVVAGRGDNYAALAKIADAALYKAKETHNGGFACSEEL